MCPRDKGAANTVWFTGEPVCRLHDVPDWVKRQRKLTKTGIDETAGCFTLPMLEHRCIVGKKIAGISPDGTEAERNEAVESWFEKHPLIKPKSNEEREKLAAHMRLLRGNPP